MLFFFFKQKTAYEMRISDWSSDVCSSDLIIIGRKLTTGIVCSSPMRPASQPQLNTATTTPNDEPIGTRMARAALIGTRIERNTENGRASCRERVCQYV